MINKEKMSFVSIIVTYGNVDRYEGVVNTIESVVDAGTKKSFFGRQWLPLLNFI